MSYNFQFHLSDFEDLNHWHKSTDSVMPGYEFASHFCHVLSESNPDIRLKVWMESLNSFLSKSSDPYGDFVKSEKFLSAKGISFLNASIEVATWAVLCEQSAEFQRIVQKFADRTQLVAFRFLSAWSLLNSDRLEECILECEKVDDSFPSIKTLQGQAYLETNQPEKSIDILEDAVDLDPNEILAWFQLAKAYSVTEQDQESWNCLMQCHRLNQHNIEIAAFLSLNAVKGQDLEKHKLAWKLLSEHMTTVGEDPFAVDLLFALANQIDRRENFELLAEQISWQRLLSTPEGRKKIPTYLESMGRHNLKEIVERKIEASA